MYLISEGNYLVKNIQRPLIATMNLGLQNMHRALTPAVESQKRALDIRMKLFGEDHTKTADRYHSVGATQHALGDDISALEL